MKRSVFATFILARLCWHGHVEPGWRCGTWVDWGDLSSHERLIFHAD